MRAICPSCDTALQATATCAPLEKWLDTLERRDQLLRAVGVAPEAIGQLAHDEQYIRQTLGPNV